MAGTCTGDDEMGMVEGMIDIQRDLSADELAQIVEYLAGVDIPVFEHRFQPTGFGMHGIFSQCGSCHEADGTGNDELNAPRLTGQYGSYLKSQIVGIRTNQRGTHKYDMFGRQMKAMAEAIRSDEDIDALVNYVLKLGSE